MTATERRKRKERRERRKKAIVPEFLKKMKVK